MKKIAILTLAVVLMLASLGVGFAKWFDRIEINGTVNTATVDLVIEDYTGTWVFKDMSVVRGPLGPETAVVQGSVDVDGGAVLEDINGNMAYAPVDAYPTGEGVWLVAYSYALPGAEEDTVTVVYENLFPTEDYDFYFVADVLLHYVGQIPAKIDFDDEVLLTGFGDMDDWLIDLMSYEMYYMGNTTPDPVGQLIDPCFQMHYCDYIDLDLLIQIPQDNDFMDLDGSFSFVLTASQWNEACLAD